MFISGDIDLVDIDPHDDLWTIGCGYQWGRYVHNFSEMYREILRRRQCLDNYDDKYNKQDINK